MMKLRTYLCAVITAICAFPLITFAEVTAEMLVNDAYADGALIATANQCQLPREEINQLIFLQKNAAISTAKSLNLPFETKDYDEYVIAGFEASTSIFNEKEISAEEMAKICKGVQEKITQKITQNKR